MSQKTVEQTRRESFEALPDLGCLDRGHGVYENPYVESAWFGFNAALDAVEIEFPPVPDPRCGGGDFHYALTSGINQCRAAVESTNLGIKVK